VHLADDLVPAPLRTPETPRPLKAVIFDVDGVLLASPHERAWRDALKGYADPARFTTALYQAEVAGRARQDGALAALVALGVRDAQGRAKAYAEEKQLRLLALIKTGGVEAFPDALRLVAALEVRGFPMAAASASRNAWAMLRSIRLLDGSCLADAFRVAVCGRNLAHGKPDPEIFLTAAAELGVPAEQCLVIEDSTAGIVAAQRGNMAALGIARLGDGKALCEAGADLVMTSLDCLGLTALLSGRLRGNSAPRRQTP